MRIFERGDPAAKLQGDLESKRKAKIVQRDDNAARVLAAEGKVAECRATVEQLALDGDDAKLDAALRARRAAEDKLAALNGAAVKIGAEVTDIEAQIERVVDQRMRAETALAVDALADRLAKAQAAHEAAALELEMAARESALVVLDGHGVTAFVMSARQQLPPAIDVILRELRSHSKGVLAGYHRASLPRPEPEPKKTAPEPPNTKGVFLLKHVVYTDADGRQHLLPKMNQADLPLALAAKALRSGAACEFSDPRFKQLSGTFGGMTPLLAHCESLDGTPTTEAPPSAVSVVVPIRHQTFDSQFEVVDRGPPITGTMRPAAIASRSDDGGEQ
jgi:hypothetical protein